MTGLATIAALAVATVVGGCGSPGETQTDTGTQPALTTSEATTTVISTPADAVAAAAFEFQRLSDELQGSDDDSPEEWTDDTTLDDFHQICAKIEADWRRFIQGLEDYRWPTSVQGPVDQVIADHESRIAAAQRCQQASTVVEALDRIVETMGPIDGLININEVRGLLGLELENN